MIEDMKVCKECGEEYPLSEFRNGGNICRLCRYKAWHEWDKSKKVCVDCGKPISRRSTRCRSCAAKETKRKMGYEPKLPNYCIDCGKEISHGSTRCNKCYGISQRGKKVSPEIRKRLSEIKKRQWAEGVYSKRGHAALMKRRWENGRMAAAHSEEANRKRRETWEKRHTQSGTTKQPLTPATQA
jgi:hypothetical protein